MDFRVLGPLEVVVDGEVVPIAAPRQRALLGLLLVNVNEVVSVDRMIECLWGDDLPSSGATALRYHVSKLRSALGVEPSPVVTRSSGYVLELPPEAVDACRFEQALAAAADVLDGAPDRAASLVRDGLGLWRGDPYSGFGDVGFVDAEVRRLVELRLRGIELGFEADLARGREVDIVAELEGALVEWPFRERLWGLLMVALYRSGRQAESLRAYQRARTALGDELGIEPSAELTALETRVLLHDPGLDLVVQQRSNLPSPVSSFIGRTAEIDELVGLCCEDRLVTITGAGGMGKSRLAVEVAGRCLSGFDDGVLLVDLTEVTDDDAVARRLLAALEIVERADRSSVESLIDVLADRNRLLVVDTCERVVDGVADVVGALLPACPSVHVIATSRVRLGVIGETLWELGGLQTGVGDGDVGESEAVRLFADRARSVRRGFAITPDNEVVVDGICRTLDGIPLAIELAAARSRIMTPAEIADHLADRFRFLADARTGGPERHRTLQSMIDWSYNLLTDTDQQLFRLLGVFRGGFTLDALQAISDEDERVIADGVERLVDASLVTVSTPGTTTRYVLLDTVGEYATGLLNEQGEMTEVRQRHAAHYASMARQAFERMDTPFSPKPDSPEEALAWRDVIKNDLANLQHALDWTLQTGVLEAALEIVTPLAESLVSAANTREAIGHLDTVLNRDDCPETSLRFAATTFLGRAHAVMDDRIRAAASLDEADRLAGRLEIAYGIADISTWRGQLALNRGDVVESVAYEEAALARADDDGDPRMSRHLWNLAHIAVLIGEIDRVRELAERFDHEETDGQRRALAVDSLTAAYEGDHQGSLELARRGLALARSELASKNFVGMIAAALVNLGQIDEARPILESQERFWHDHGIATDTSHSSLGLVDLRSGDIESARIRLRAAIKNTHTLGNRYRLWETFYAAAEWFAHTNDNETAAVLLGHCSALAEQHRYAPAALECTPVVSLDDLADQLDSQQLADLTAAGASTTTDEIVTKTLNALSN